MKARNALRTIDRRQLLKSAAAAAGLAAGSTLSTRSFAQARKRSVNIWVHFGGANLDILNRYVAEFQQAQPDIEIKITAYGPSEKIGRASCRERV